MKTVSPFSENERQTIERLMIFEMMEASIALSLEKGPHRLNKGCSCIVCVNKRKQILNGPIREWKYKL
jgi:hypothetical protein